MATIKQLQRNVLLLAERKDFLLKTNPSSLTNKGVEVFEKTVHHWFPVYEHFGENIYAKSSLLWRIISYLNSLPFDTTKLTGFDTYTKLGKDRVIEDMKNSNMSEFKKFLKEDIAKEILWLSDQITSDNNEIQRNIIQLSSPSK